MRYGAAYLLSVSFGLMLLALPVRADDKKAKITYDEHVQAIFREHCLACHNQDKMRGGLVLHTFPGAMAGGSSGEVIKAGDPDGSRLLALISHKEEPHMPPKSPMIPAEKIATIQQWIAGGALENSGSKAKVAKPKAELALSGAVRGKPSGPPPMPSAKLNVEPLVKAARANAVTALASSPWAPVFAVGGQKQVASSTVIVGYIALSWMLSKDCTAKKDTSNPWSVLPFSLLSLLPL